MPIYMDVHNVPGVTAQDVAEAHLRDLVHQDEHGCKCMTYWIDEARENIFCLVEAPTMENVEEMHRKAHGLIPNKLIEVSSNIVESFLGRIYDPGEARINDAGLKVFSDSAFRVLLVTKTKDPALLKRELSPDRASELFTQHNSIVRKEAAAQGGREVEHEGTGFILSFPSAASAVSCALSIQKQMSAGAGESLGFRLAINGGEPVERSSKLFGDAIQLAEQLCLVSKPSQVGITSAIRDLIEKDHFLSVNSNLFVLSPPDEALLTMLFMKLEENWQDAGFDVDEYCRAMAMSKSSFYRKCISLTGLAPNILLRDFRLEKAKEMMKRKSYSIAQVTFDSGFTSASYFTKCFKKKFGLLPMAYVELI
jgi:AraC-like DNA-binding protein